jgi:dipeptidyl aminopeptidase/acylaminoacyl peptidase
MSKRFWITCLSWSLICLSAYAAEPARDVTVDDYFSLASIAEFKVSPHGDYVAYGEARWQQSSDDRRADIWVVSTGAVPQPRKLTFDRANDHCLRWSADSRTIYFLGNRKRPGETRPPYDGSNQVWRVSVDGGELQAVTCVEKGISQYDLSRDNQLWYSVDVIATDEDAFSKQRQQFAGLEYGHGKRTVSEIWRLDLATWRSERAVAANRYVREFAVTGDGKRLAMITAFDDSVLKSEGESRVDIWEEGKTTTPPTDPYRAQAATPHAWLESLAWSVDGLRFAFCAIFDAHPAEIVIGSKSGSGWAVGMSKRPIGIHVHGYGSPLRWHPGGQLFYLAEREGRVAVVPTDWEPIDSTSSGAASLNAFESQPFSDRVVYGFDMDDAGKKAIYAVGDSQHFADLCVGDLKLNGELRKLTAVNPQTAGWRLPDVRHVEWKGAGGATVGGILELPSGYVAGTKLPLIVGIHGGPTTSVKATLEFDPYLGRVWLPGKGYAVLCPNYRGSTGYGDAFVADLICHENDVDVRDIVAGVQSLVASGLVDPDRIGVMGWSNGGYLTNCLIARKDLPFALRAASSGAGILDTVMEWGVNDEPAYPKAFKTGLPWEKPEVFHATSPVYGLANAKTPTLIHVGANDVRCPPVHSRMLYRSLHEFLNVPTELVVYPGEPHGLGKYSSRKAKMEWDLAWFEKYVKAAKP